jgi:hypothetical protein
MIFQRKNVMRYALPRSRGLTRVINGRALLKKSSFVTIHQQDTIDDWRGCQCLWRIESSCGKGNGLDRDSLIVVDPPSTCLASSAVRQRSSVALFFYTHTQVHRFVHAETYLLAAHGSFDYECSVKSNNPSTSLFFSSKSISFPRWMQTCTHACMHPSINAGQYNCATCQCTNAWRCCLLVYRYVCVCFDQVHTVGFNQASLI